MSQPLQVDVDFLEHFGVKGMRWGVRKQQATPIRDGAFIAKSILKQVGQKRVSDIPSYKELKYGYGYQITNLVQNILDMTS